MKLGDGELVVGPNICGALTNPPQAVGLHFINSTAVLVVLSMSMACCGTG